MKEQPGKTGDLVEACHGDVGAAQSSYRVFHSLTHTHKLWQNAEHQDLS